MSRNMIPRATSEYLTMQDKTVYCIFTDGSRRRVPARVRGKARVKAAKRARRRA